MYIYPLFCRFFLGWYIFLNFLFIIYYFYFWLCWVFVSVWELSPVAASGGHSSSRHVGLSLSRPLLLRSRGSRHSGSVVVAHGPSCSAACGIFPDQGSNPCPLHWQANSQPLRHQGSPGLVHFWKSSVFIFSFFLFPFFVFCFWFFCHAARCAGSQFPDQGLNPGHGSESPES